jgi:hypothetical protein
LAEATKLMAETQTQSCSPQRQRGAGKVQGRGAVAAGDHVGSLAVVGQSLFEGGDRLTLGEVVRLQHGDDGFDIFICDGLASIGIIRRAPADS